MEKKGKQDFFFNKFILTLRRYQLCITFAPMLKRLTAFCLLVALISSNFSRFFACSAFEANQKYIAKNLCINKSRPWLHCNGHCYFMQKIKQAEENEKKEAAKDNLNKLEISFFQEPFHFASPVPVVLKSGASSYPGYAYHYSSQFLDTIFRPPKSLI